MVGQRRDPHSALTAGPEEGSPGGPGSTAFASLQQGDTGHLPGEGLVADRAGRGCGALPRARPYETAILECQFQ